MLKCPACGRVYEDNSQMFCLNDGTALVGSNPAPPPTVNYSGSLNNQPFSAAAPPPKKKSNTLLILGGVGLLMAVLFFGVVLVVGLILNAKKGNDPANTANINAQPTPSTLTTNGNKYEPELKMAIISANTAEATASATLNTNELDKYYSGEALKAIKANIEQLKGLKMMQTAVLKNQDYEYFKVNDAGTEAEVRVVETWETTYFRVPDAKCLGYNPPTRLPQVIYLKKVESGWMIDAIIHDQQNKINPQPCPKKK